MLSRVWRFEEFNQRGNDNAESEDVSFAAVRSVAVFGITLCLDLLPNVHVSYRTTLT